MAKGKDTKKSTKDGKKSKGTGTKDSKSKSTNPASTQYPPSSYPHQQWTGPSSSAHPEYYAPQTVSHFESLSQGPNPFQYLVHDPAQAPNPFQHIVHDSPHSQGPSPFQYQVHDTPSQGASPFNYQVTAVPSWTHQPSSRRPDPFDYQSVETTIPAQAPCRGVNPFDYQVDEFPSHQQQVSRGGTKLSVKVRNGNATEAAPHDLSDAVSQLVDLTLDMLERQDLAPFQIMVSLGAEAVKTWEKAGRKFVYKDDWKNETKMRKWLSTFIGLLRQSFIPIELIDLYEKYSNKITMAQFNWENWAEKAGTEDLGDWRPHLAGTIWIDLMGIKSLVEWASKARRSGTDKNSELIQEAYEACFAHWTLIIAHELQHAFISFLSGELDIYAGTPKALCPDEVKTDEEREFGRKFRGESGRWWEKEALGGCVNFRENTELAKEVPSLHGAGCLWLMNQKATRVCPKSIKRFLTRDFAFPCRPSGLP